MIHTPPYFIRRFRMEKAGWRGQGPETLAWGYTGTGMESWTKQGFYENAE